MDEFSCKQVLRPTWFLILTLQLYVVMPSINCAPARPSYQMDGVVGGGHEIFTGRIGLTGEPVTILFLSETPSVPHLKIGTFGQEFKEVQESEVPNGNADYWGDFVQFPKSDVKLGTVLKFMEKGYALAWGCEESAIPPEYRVKTIGSTTEMVFIQRMEKESNGFRKEYEGELELLIVEFGEKGRIAIVWSPEPMCGTTINAFEIFLKTITAYRRIPEAPRYSSLAAILDFDRNYKYEAIVPILSAFEAPGIGICRIYFRARR